MADKKYLELWNRVATPAAGTTKPARGTWGSFTSIDAYSIMKLATEELGPIGIGFGLKDVTYQWFDGFLFAHGTFWWRDPSDEDQVGEYETADLIEWQGTRKNGNPFTDEEAPKKVITGLYSKSLSYLGFGADVYMGKFDQKDGSDKRNSERDTRQHTSQTQPSEKPVARKITEAQRKRLWAIYQQRMDSIELTSEKTVRQDFLQRLVFDQTGQGSSREISMKDYDPLIQCIERLLPEDVKRKMGEEDLESQAAGALD